MISKPLAILSLLIATALTTTTRADLVLDFSTDSGTSFSNSIDVETGDQLVVQLFLRQSGLETRLTSNGILGFGTKATYDGQVVTVSNASVDPATYLDFLGTTGVVSATEFNLTGAASFESPPQGANILLGQFTLDVDSVGTTTLQFGDFDPASTDFTLNDLTLTGFDELLFSDDPINNINDRSQTFALTINATLATAVPEPSSLAIAFLGIAVMTSRRRNR